MNSCNPPSSSSAYHEAFLDVLVEDEEDSGSELGELEEDVADEDENIMDIESMLLVMVDESDPLSLTTQHDGDRETTSDIINENWRERSRSPLRPSTSNPNSPVPSTRRTPESERFVAFYSQKTEEPEVETGPLIPPHKDTAAIRGRRPSRGQFRSRGSRPRGGNRGIGCPSSGLSGDSGRRRGELVIEVCLDDEDVPPRLREMVRELERARTKQMTGARRNLRINDDRMGDSEDEFYDAESSLVNELFSGDNVALNFEWFPMATFEGSREPFQPELRPGPCCETPCGYEAFRQFWDDTILEHIVKETNRYASELKSSSPRFARDWHDTNSHEILVLFAFWIMLGIVRMPSIKSCFSNSYLLKTSVFRKLLTEPRYWQLNRALHFVNNGSRNPNSSKLFCLGPVVDYLNNKFMDAYTPDQDIVIDESIVSCKGIQSFKQYIKTKAARFGIKTYELCEAATGYIWSFIICQGKDRAATSKIPKSIEIVVKLIKPLLNRGYCLFMDSWFNSPVLARYLKRNKTDCIGTLPKSRKDMPALIKLASIPEGTCIARHSGDVVVMAYQDKKTIYTISTFHGTDSVHIAGKPGRPGRDKPAVIVDYNSKMGTIDKENQMLEPYLVEQKRCQKWYKKIFKKLLNMSIFNSRILVQNSTNEPAKQLAFRLELVDEIMKRHLVHVPKPRQRSSSNRNADMAEDRFVGMHFVVRICDDEPRTYNKKNRTSRNRRNCMWCTVRLKRYAKTVYMCEQCEVPLCLEGCFKNYHTIH